MACHEGGHALLAKSRGRGRSRVALEELERNGRVDLEEDGSSARPELFEQIPQLVGQRDALCDQVVAQPDEPAQRLGFVGERREHTEAMAIGAQYVGEQVRITRIGLPLSRRVAGPRCLDRIRMDRHDGEATLDQRIDDDARRSLDRDAQLVRPRQLLQSRRQLRHAGRAVLHGEARYHGPFLVDDADGVLTTCPIQTHEVPHGRSSRRTSTDARGAYRTLIERHSATRTSGRNILLSVKAPRALRGGRSHPGRRTASEQGRPRRCAGGTSHDLGRTRSRARLSGLHGSRVHQ